MTDSNPYHTPASDLSLPDEETNEIQELATLGERFGAALIDGIIIGILSTAISLVYWRFISDHLPDALAEVITEIAFSGFWNGFLDTIVGFVLFVMVQGYLLAEKGQTVGKKLVGIKIVTMGGAKPRMEALLLLRTLVPLLLGTIPVAGPYIYLAGIVIIFARPRRCLHDYLAGTKVVQARALPRGVTRGKENGEQTPARFPELILAPIIRQYLGVEPRTLGESTSWAGDLGMAEAKIRAFHQKVDQAFPPTTGPGRKPSQTYGELLATLGIPPAHMMRVPGKIAYRAPTKPGEP